MKHILQILVNLWAWGSLSLISFFGILWYGKLPKVSLYHWTNKRHLYKTKDIYNDIDCQVKSINDVPTRIKHKIIEEYILALRNNNLFKSNVNIVNIPLFDGKEVYGTRSIYSLLNEIKESLL